METVQNPARYNELLKGPKSRPAAGANAEGTKGQSLSQSVSQSMCVSHGWVGPHMSHKNGRANKHTTTGLIAWDELPSLLKQLREDPLSLSMRPPPPPSAGLPPPQPPPPVPASEDDGTLAVGEGGNGAASNAKWGAVWPFRARA